MALSLPPLVKLCYCQPTCNVKGGPPPPQPTLWKVGISSSWTWAWLVLFGFAFPLLFTVGVILTSFVFASKGVTFQEVKAKICCSPALFILVVWVFLENTLQNLALTGFIRFQDFFYGGVAAEIHHVLYWPFFSFFSGILGLNLDSIFKSFSRSYLTEKKKKPKHQQTKNPPQFPFSHMSVCKGRFWRKTC